MSDELEDKAIEALKTLTESVAKTPLELLSLYVVLRTQFKDNPSALQQIDEAAKEFVKRIPELARIMSDATKVLETYLTYKTARRQETATESLLHQNKIPSRATVVLALSNVVLAAATILLHF